MLQNRFGLFPDIYTQQNIGINEEIPGVEHWSASFLQGIQSTIDLITNDNNNLQMKSINISTTKHLFLEICTTSFNVSQRTIYI